MKYLFALLLIATSAVYAQTADNIIIITTDGFRWHEVFTGMDSAIANNKKFNQDDSAGIFKKYWANDPTERRKKLMPFLWSTIEEGGQIYGNRNYDNKVDNANPYWFSYPGYNEIFTGYPDTAVNSNSYKANPNTNLLEFLNKNKSFRNKVAAFGAWDAFDRIFNEERSKFPVYSAYDDIGGPAKSAEEKMINTLRNEAFKPMGDEECLDVFTHYGAMDYLKNKKPKVLYIAYGETDEWAHSGHYKDYLDAAFMVDKWISDLWTYIQHDPMYKNKTVLFITTDHGRGDANKEEWTSHNNKIKDAHEIWMAAMGPGIKAKGEIKKTGQLYQKQFAQTIASLLGLHFTCEHAVAEKISLNGD
jgi:hypothetical protein